MEGLEKKEKEGGRKRGSELRKRGEGFDSELSKFVNTLKSHVSG